MKLRDRVAVVTGAGGGIGRAIALALARRGCHLALADIDGAGLAETARQAEALGVARQSATASTSPTAPPSRRCPTTCARRTVASTCSSTTPASPLGGTFEQVSEADFDWLIAINFDAVVRMTRAFLPLLASSDDARIVNVSSIYGLVAPPGQTAYSASKFAVRGFSNALRHELEGTRVGVTVVHPGGVATAIARNARVPAGVAPKRSRGAARRARRCCACRRHAPARSSCAPSSVDARACWSAPTPSSSPARAARRRCATGACSAACCRAERPRAGVGARSRAAPRRRQRAPLTTQCGGHSQNAEPLARPDAFALCSIASIGARSRSP